MYKLNAIEVQCSGVTRSVSPLAGTSSVTCQSSWLGAETTRPSPGQGSLHANQGAPDGSSPEIMHWPCVSSCRYGHQIAPTTRCVHALSICPFSYLFTAHCEFPGPVTSRTNSDGFILAIWVSSPPRMICIRRAFHFSLIRLEYSPDAPNRSGRLRLSVDLHNSSRFAHAGVA